MEQDIIERLRIMASDLKWTAGCGARMLEASGFYVSKPCDEHTADVLKEAAMEIEKLRKALARVRSAMTSLPMRT